ncbi:uncharacterized protein LOC115412713 [Sphaeramia orbicularis]|uniref:uncharacterized protein LOC115412713 n=1 Tax=Sphaeramia orbicularis TaxID=375764 RepID=UPI00117FD853|nr:uncharacterized protein LOC115412713 [Sphaeramia orbicularis]
MGDAFYFLSPSGGADPGASDESPQCQMQNVLQNLNASKLISDECLRSALQLVEGASKNPECFDLLITFIDDLQKCLKNLNLKPESDEETRGSWWSNLGRSSKTKVFVDVSGETFGAHKYIKNKLKSKVDLVPNPQDCDVIVLFCPVSSRVGSDVEAALKKIPDSGRRKPVILVLMHHTRNIYYSGDESDWSDEHGAVVSHVHVLFHETQKGLLTCPKNDQAVQSLLDQCIKHAK